MVECSGKKIPLLKLFKCLLTVSRGILLIAFLTKGPFCVPLPTISLITVFFYSFKYTIGLSILGVILATLSINVISNCLSSSLGDSCEVLWDSIFLFIAYAIKIFKMLLWDYTDYPFFKEYRYGSIIFDCARYGLFALSIPIFAGVEYGYLVKKNGILTSDHVDALVIYVMYLLPLIMLFSIELIRLIQARRIQTDLIDVFGVDEIFSKKCKSIFSYSQYGLYACNSLSYDKKKQLSCPSLEPEHILKCHMNYMKRPDLKEVNYNQKGENIAIGFHRTSIDAIVAIKDTKMKPSERDNLWIGHGIYFANNLDATSFKAVGTDGKPLGAIICAKIDLGRYKRIEHDYLLAHGRQNIKLDQLRAEEVNSVYLFHTEENKDEFTIPDADCIIEFVIMVDENAISQYRARVH